MGGTPIQKNPNFLLLPFLFFTSSSVDLSTELNSFPFLPIDMSETLES